MSFRELLSYPEVRTNWKILVEIGSSRIHLSIASQRYTELPGLIDGVYIDSLQPPGFRRFINCGFMALGDMQR